MFVTPLVTEFITPQSGDFPVNIIPNQDFSGGYPPTGYSLIFNTTTGRMIDNGDGTFRFESNFDQISGRNVMSFQLSTAALTPGTRYRLEYTVQKVNSSNYSAALAYSGSSNITVHASDVVAVGGTTKKIWSEFTPSAGYDAQIRIGCGTTANNTAHLIYSKPRLYEI